MRSLWWSCVVCFLALSNHADAAPKKQKQNPAPSPPADEQNSAPTNEMNITITWSVTLTPFFSTQPPPTSDAALQRCLDIQNTLNVEFQLRHQD